MSLCDAWLVADPDIKSQVLGVCCPGTLGEPAGPSGEAGGARSLIVSAEMGEPVNLP